MDVSGPVAVFNGLMLACLALGGGAATLTLAAAGLCTMFAWLDMHIGGFIKKVFASVVMGGSMLGGAGAFGLWLTNTLHLTGAPAAPAAPAAAGVLLALFS